MEATARYLVMQARAGAQALKIFESWAEGLAEDVFERIVIRPHAAIVEKVRAAGVTAPFIGFPRGAGALVEAYAERGAGRGGRAGHPGLRRARPAAADAAARPSRARWTTCCCGPAARRWTPASTQLLEQWGDGPYIFNLGHGILPDTPIEHIARVVERVTGKAVEGRAREARRRPVQPRRPGWPGGGAAVPVQPVQATRRSSQLPALGARYPLAALIAAAAREAGAGQLRRHGRRLAPAAGDRRPRPRPGAALTARRPDDRGAGVHRHALLAAVRRRDGARRSRPSRRTRSSCCRSIRSISTTTTASSLKAWRAAYRGPGPQPRGLLLPDAPTA